MYQYKRGDFVNLMFGPLALTTLFNKKRGGNLPPTGASLSAYTWEQIAAVSEAGVASNYWNIGDEIDIDTIGTVQIYDFSHDDLVGGGVAGITFGMKNSLNTKRALNAASTNAGGWEAAELRAGFLTTTAFDGLPEDLRNVIKSSAKSTANGGSQAGSDVIITADKLFLFSEVEVLGTNPSSHPGEGFRYPIFQDGNYTKANMSGNTSGWWTRSPAQNSTSHFRNFGWNGANSAGGANSTNGISFGFCV